jgi:replication factor A1
MDNIPDDITKIYERLSSSIPLEDFMEKVQQKVESMSGLCDEKTAAMLVAHELGADMSIKISEIDLEKRSVAFVGTIADISPIREFKRNGDVGHVANVVVSDETGSVRVVLWNELAEHAEELRIGQTLRISGFVKEGLYGIEVNARNVQVDDSEVNISPEEPSSTKKISALVPGLGDVNISGVVLEVSPVRTFSRRDGTTGKVSGIAIGDETGKVRVALWDDKAEKSSNFKPDDIMTVEHGYTRERYGRLEVHVGNRGDVKKSTEHVEFKDHITRVKDVELNVPCTVMGDIDSVGSLREFTRSDGNVGKVRSVAIKDGADEIRVTLWGDRAESINEGDEGKGVIIRDCMPKTGLIEGIELSVDWRSGVCFVDEGTKEQQWLEKSPEVEDVSIEGTVIGSNSRVCVDNGTECITFEKGTLESDLKIGDEVIVTGEKEKNATSVTVKSVSKLDGGFEEKRIEDIKSRIDRL